jgi:hypothetical protein
MTEGEVRLHIRRTKQLADILERESTPRDA